MANKLRYQIDEAYNADGTNKEFKLDEEFRKLLPHIYFIKSMKQGRPATFIAEDNTVLRTSTVREIFIWENGIKLTTDNTIYYLNPYMVGENDENIERLF